MKTLASMSRINCAEFSPCGRFVAFTSNSKLSICNAGYGQVSLEFDCGDIIDVLQWSKDSIHILCVMRQKSKVEVFSLLNPRWACRIKTGSEGLQRAVWSPDGEHILTLSEFSIRIRVWSLKGIAVGSVEISRNFSDNLLTFSGCGKFMAVSPNEDSEKLQIFSTKIWECEKEITNRFKPTNGPFWSPTGEIFALYDRSDTVCEVMIFSAKTGKQVGGFQRESSKKLKGVRSLSWCQSGQLLAISCYDDSIFILDHILWSLLIKLTHSKSISQMNCSIFQQKDNEFHEIKQRPISLTCADRKESHFSPGVKFLCFDQRSEFFASVSEIMPAIIWMWKMEDFSLVSALVLKERVTALSWSSNGKLAVCDQSGVTIWHNTQLPIFVNVSPTPSEKTTETELKWQPGKCESLILVRGSSVSSLLKEFFNPLVQKQK